MTDEELEVICNKLISYCESLNGCPITIQAWGGEPLLETSKIAYIRKRFDERGLNPQILVETNATLITKEIASFLVENRIGVGISIDGPAGIHNAQRPFQNGKPSLTQVERGILNLQEAGYNDFGSITVVTRKTYKFLPEVIGYLTEKLHIKSIKMNLMRKTPRNHDLAINTGEIGNYVDGLLRCLRGCEEKGIHVIEQNVSQRVRNLLFRTCDNVCNAFGCHGGYRMLSIDAHGDVYPCELTDDYRYKLGSIHDSKFNFKSMVCQAISDKQAYFQERKNERCGECAWRFYCRGGCRTAAKYIYGDPTMIDETECAFNRELYPRLVEIVLNEPNFTFFCCRGLRNEVHVSSAWLPL